MELRDATTRDSLSLTLRGYQFPEVTDVWDSNWLLIAIEGSLGGRAWSVVTPCLDTHEVARLSAWLTAVSDGSAERSLPEFTEPTLSFECVETAGDAVRMRVWLELEARPPWARTGFVGLRDLAIELTVSPEAVQAAATDLREQLERFPTRVERSI